MAFDPDAYLRSVYGNSFDPDRYLSGSSQFDPDEYIRSLNDELFDPDEYLRSIEDPSLGEIGTGLLAEIAVAEGSKYAGATAGAALGSVVPGLGTAVGAGIGYASGAIAGGISGSIAAQKLEGRDEISWGRVTADTLLNLLPGGAGKITKGQKILPKIASTAIKRGAQGAGLSTAGMQIEKGIEEGEFLTPEELLAAAGTGAGLGIGLGSLGTALNKSYSKLLNKTPDQIDKLYDSGDIDAITVVDAITGGKPTGSFMRTLNLQLKKVAPSLVIGNRASEDVRRAVNEAQASREIANTAYKRINRVYKKLDPNDKELMDLYVDRKSTTLPESAMSAKADIDEARDLIQVSQEKILQLSDQGFLDLDDVLVSKIKNSAANGTYLTREYRFYEDPDYVPSPQSEYNLRKYMEKRGLSQDQINEEIRKINDTRDSPIKGLNTIAENSRLFKERDQLSGELQEYLGVYREPGEKILGTLRRLGQYASEQEGSFRIAKTLRDSGAAITKNQIPGELSSEYKLLRVKDKVLRVDGEELYVLPEVLDSVNALFGTKMIRDASNATDNFIQKLISTTTGLQKFVKVPLNPAAYSPQLFGNMFMVAGQGMNPFKGFGEGLRVAAGEISDKLSKVSLKDLNRYKSLGLVDKDVIGSDIRNAVNKGFDLKRPGKALRATTSKIGKTYSAIDTANRISVFENYKKQLRNMAPNLEDDIIKKGMDPDELLKMSPAQKKELAQERIDRVAADLTNTTYQNYDRVSPALRSLSRYGLLNEFASFILELSRTTFNQGRLARDLVNGSFSERMKREFGINIDKRSAQVEGAKRAGFLSGALGAATFGISKYNKENGVDEETEQAIRTIAAPSYMENSALVIKKDGDDIEMNDMSYQMPVADLTSIFEAGIGTGSFEEAGSGLFDAFAEKFIGKGTMNMQAVYNAIQNVDPKKGKKISTEVGTLDNVLDRAMYYGGSFKPGIVSEAEKLGTRTVSENVMRLLFGQRKTKTTISKGAYFKFKDLTDNINSLRSSYNSDVKNNKNVDSDYEEKNKSYRDNIAKAIEYVGALRTLGKTEDEIEEMLKKTGRNNFTVEARESIMNGTVTDMRIAPSIQGDRASRIEKYVEVFNKLSPELGVRMLQQELDLNKIDFRLYDLIRQSLQINSLRQ